MQSNTTPEDILEFHTAQEWNDINSRFSSNLIIVTFFTNTCPICKSFAPNFQAAQKEFKLKPVVFGRINAEEVPLVAAQLGIEGVPQTLFIKEKEIIRRMTGNISKIQLRGTINDLLVKYFHQKPVFDDSSSMYM
jgi:thioredoxin-like negative regulator of GroEL